MKAARLAISFKESSVISINQSLSLRSSPSQTNRPEGGSRISETSLLMSRKRVCMMLIALDRNQTKFGVDANPVTSLDQLGNVAFRESIT